MATSREVRHARMRRRLDGAVHGLIGVAVVVFGWWLLVATRAVSPLVVPFPTEVLQATGSLLANLDFWRQIANTGWTWLTALILATAIATPLGLLIGLVARLYPPTAGLVHVLRSVPSTALIPIAILFFGLGAEMKIAITFYAVFFPLLLNAIYGVHAIDSMMRLTARSLRWPRWTVFTRLIVPGSAQYIGSALRFSGGIGLVVTVSAELLGASAGIGTRIVQYTQAQRPDLVYAAIILVGLLGVAIYSLLSRLEAALSPWIPGNRKETA